GTLRTPGAACLPPRTGPPAHGRGDAMVPGASGRHAATDAFLGVQLETKQGRAMSDATSVIEADLPVAGVSGLVTTRRGRCSSGAWAAMDGRGGLNLGFGSGDARDAVSTNRRQLAALLPQEPRWLRQVHGAAVVEAESVEHPIEADASTSVTPGTVCAVLIA